MRFWRNFITVGLVIPVLGGAVGECVLQGDTGYVEIKTVPVVPANATIFYLDTVKLDPLKNGSAVLRQGVGTAKLATDGAAGKTLLCEIVVRKNRITTVTVSVIERPPRCQCRAAETGSRACTG